MDSNTTLETPFTLKNFAVNASLLIAECKRSPSEEFESETIEFKCYNSHKSLCDSKELAEEVVALANTKGGLIIIGVKDSSNVPHGKWEMQLEGIVNCDVVEFEQRLRGKIKPKIDLKIRQINFESKRYVIIAIPHSKDALVSTSSGKIYRRDGRSSVPMLPDDVVNAVKNLQSYDWSNQDVTYHADDLYQQSVEDARIDYCSRRNIPSDSINRDAFLEAIGATKNGSLNKAGLLMFGDFKSIRNEIGLFENRFSWKTKGGALIVNDVWHGNLWASIKRFQSHFESCNSKIDFKFKGKEYSAPLFDSTAFHEAMMNALVHRDYSSEGMVSVDYDSSKMKISNPGKFYGGVTPYNITHHQPRHRNKCLAQLLMAFQLVDRAGMGIKRMGRQSLMYGRRFPKFTEDSECVTVTMHGEALRPGIFVTSQNDQYGLDLPQFYILNMLYKVGYKLIDEVQSELSSVFDLDWEEIIEKIETMQHLQLCGTKEGIFVRVDSTWNYVYEVVSNLRTHAASSKYVQVYKLVKKCGEVSNEDVRKLLAHKGSSQTSQFLRSCKFLENSGSGVSSRWVAATS